MADFPGRLYRIRLFREAAQKDKAGRLLTGGIRERALEPGVDPPPVQPLPYVVGPGGDITPVDLCLDGLDRLMYQYADSALWRGWICAILEVFQGAEDDAEALRSQVLAIDAAEGAQLNIIGRIVGEPRGGRLDASYRLALRVRVLANKSNGRTEDLISIALAWSGLDPSVSGQVVAREYYPAGVSITPLAAAAEPGELHKRLVQAKGGGIDVASVHLPEGDAAGFRFSLTYAAPDDSAAQGWGSVYDAAVGGVLPAGF